MWTDELNIYVEHTTAHTHSHTTWHERKEQKERIKWKNTSNKRYKDNQMASNGKSIKKTIQFHYDALSSLHNFSNFVVALSRLSILFYSSSFFVAAIIVLYFLFFSPALSSNFLCSIGRLLCAFLRYWDSKVVFFCHRFAASIRLPSLLSLSVCVFFICCVFARTFLFSYMYWYCMHACMFDPETLSLSSRVSTPRVNDCVCVCVCFCLHNTWKYLLLLFSPFSWHLANTSGYKSIYILHLYIWVPCYTHR